HQNWLGHTRAQIASEKAGIIKPGVPVITATDAPEALEVIAKTAREKDAPLTKVGQASSLSVADGTPALALLGEHQRLNAALAVATVQALQERIHVGDDAIQRGLRTVQWPGRLQLVTTASGQTILLDGAHNAAGADALRKEFSGEAIQRAISVRSPSAKGSRDLCGHHSGCTLILGVLQDKDWQQV